MTRQSIRLSESPGALAPATEAAQKALPFYWGALAATRPKGENRTLQELFEKELRPSIQEVEPAFALLQSWGLAFWEPSNPLAWENVKELSVQNFKRAWWWCAFCGRSGETLPLDWCGRFQLPEDGVQEMGFKGIRKVYRTLPKEGRDYWRQLLKDRADGLAGLMATLCEPIIIPPGLSQSEQVALLAQVNAEQEAAKRQSGFYVAAELRTPEHFRWLADYQVGGLSYREVAAKYNQRSYNTVGRDIRKTAALLGLPLRSASEPGRPPKS